MKVFDIAIRIALSRRYCVGAICSHFCLVNSLESVGAIPNSTSSSYFCFIASAENRFISAKHTDALPMLPR